MKNAQPRFGLHEESGMLHDYVTGRTVDPIVGTVTDADGVWDLPLVVTLITEGKSIEGAFAPTDLINKEADLKRTRNKLKWTQGELDKCQQANAEFTKNTPPADPNDKVEKTNADFNSGSTGQ